ncbi:MAG: hypothetical protein VX335_00840 [Pseudomonadota bacterium]|nr:hypothetical protein [Pseudomonadota bacterium]
MHLQQKYTYIKDGKVFLIMPIMGGSEISTDNTCATFSELSAFINNAEREVAALRLMISRDEIVGIDQTALPDLDIYIDMLQEVKLNLGRSSSSVGFNTKETKKLLSSGLHAIVLDSAWQRDTYLKSTNTVFSVSHSRQPFTSNKDDSYSKFSANLREFLLFRSRQHKTVTPKIEKFNDELKKVNDIKPESYSSHEEYLIAVCYQAWKNLGYNNRIWQEVENLLKLRINAIKQQDLFDEDITPSYIAQSLNDSWDFLLDDYLSNISWFYKAADGREPASNETHEGPSNKLAVLVQFFLAITNIYLKENKRGLDRNLGKYFDPGSGSAHKLVMTVMKAFEQGLEIEGEILKFLENEFFFLRLDEKDKELIKKSFNSKYNLIKHSDHFDEFFILPTDTQSKFFTYAGSICCEFSHFATQCLESHKNKYSKQKKHMNFFKNKLESFSSIARTEENELMFSRSREKFYFLGSEENFLHEIDTIVNKVDPKYKRLEREVKVFELKSITGCSSHEEYLITVCSQAWERLSFTTARRVVAETLLRKRIKDLQAAGQFNEDISPVDLVKCLEDSWGDIFENYVGKKVLPGYFDISRKFIIPRSYSESDRKKFEADLRQTDEYKILSIIKSNDDEKAQEKVFNFLQGKYDIVYKQRLEIDIQKLSSYPESIQRKYLLENKENIKRLDPENLNVNLYFLGFELNEVLDTGLFKPTQLRSAGFPIQDFYNLKISFWDLYINDFDDLGSYLPSCSSNTLRSFAFSILTKCPKNLNDFADLGKSGNLRGFSLNYLKALNFSASNLREMNYSLYDLWMESFTKEEIIKAGFPVRMTNILFLNFDIRQPDISESEMIRNILNAFRNNGFSFHEIKECGFSIDNLRSSFNIDDPSFFKELGYTDKQIRAAGYSLISVIGSSVSSMIKNSLGLNNKLDSLIVNGGLAKNSKLQTVNDNIGVTAVDRDTSGNAPSNSKKGI